jgi:hypothetical protein
MEMQVAAAGLPETSTSVTSPPWPAAGMAVLIMSCNDWEQSKPVCLAVHRILDGNYELKR